jgi:Concanavalin A-like lectin/glucanases superfamily
MPRSHLAPRAVHRGRGPWSPAVRLATVGLVLGTAGAAGAQTVSPNTGSLGPSANATNSATVTFGPGAVTAGGDQSAVYSGATGSSTVRPFLPALNPPAASPFTIEFWAQPTASDNDDAPVSNRVAAGNRSGWVFFQRAAATGWNFRMYNGVAGGLGWDLTGGTANLNAWSHVVATWNGSAATLYVNGVLADATNDPAATGVYNASGSADLILAATDTGSPYAGLVDETAFYAAALTPAQILNHFNTASSGTPGAYHALVQSDGALLQLSNNAVPEPGTVVLTGTAALLMFGRRAVRRRKQTDAQQPGPA